MAAVAALCVASPSRRTTTLPGLKGTDVLEGVAAAVADFDTCVVDGVTTLDGVVVRVPDCVAVMLGVVVSALVGVGVAALVGVVVAALVGVGVAALEDVLVDDALGDPVDVIVAAPDDVLVNDVLGVPDGVGIAV